jgi:hypothetical protein
MTGRITYSHLREGELRLFKLYRGNWSSAITVSTFNAKFYPTLCREELASKGSQKAPLLSDEPEPIANTIAYPTSGDLEMNKRSLIFGMAKN